MAISQVEQVPVGELRLNPANVRKHSKKQISQLAEIIRQVGFLVPIIADEKRVVQAGNGRLLAAREIGLRSVPVITASGLSDAKRRAYVVADNKIAQGAGWDRSALAAELHELAPLLLEEGLTIDLTGFEAGEIDGLWSDFLDSETDPIDAVPTLDSTRSTSCLGDLWLLTNHRLYCGDSRKQTDVRSLLGVKLASMVFSDPPYNVKIKTTIGRGKTKHREFAHASGEMSPPQFVTFLNEWMRLAAQFSEDGSIHYICIDWRHLSELFAASKDVYTELKNVIVWAKTNAGQGSFYRSQHEFIFVFKNGDGPHQNNVELGRHGRNRSNLWTYAGVNTFRTGRLDELTVHPTVKPVALVADAMRDCSRRGEIILDPFMGSGTTILAAEKVGRRAYGLEIDPLYVDVAVKRWQEFTKRDAILKATGQTFDEVAAERAPTAVGGPNARK
jgi:DNA modification methylase